MRLLLLGGSSPTRAALKNLLGKSGHRLQWHRLEHGALDADPRDFDLVLVDGGSGECQETAQLLDIAHHIGKKAPELPILVLHLLEPMPHGCGKQSGHSCGISKSADGVWHMRCRLKELAWNETAALIRDRLERAPEEPVTFEFKG